MSQIGQALLVHARLESQRHSRILPASAGAGRNAVRPANRGDRSIDRLTARGFFQWRAKSRVGAHRYWRKKKASAFPCRSLWREMPERFRPGNDNGCDNAHSPAADLHWFAAQRWQMQKDSGAPHATGVLVGSAVYHHQGRDGTPTALSDSPPPRAQKNGPDTPLRYRGQVLQVSRPSRPS